MRDVEPQLLRLREIECHVALAEFNLRVQDELVERLRSDGLDTELALQVRHSMARALELFRDLQALVLTSQKFAPLPQRRAPLADAREPSQIGSWFDIVERTAHEVSPRLEKVPPQVPSHPRRRSTD